MKIEILHVPDCPNVALMDQRLNMVLAASTEVTHRVVADEEAAAAAGMTGSPTLLIDGVDPFARNGLEPSLSCRLYPSEDGRADGAPSVDELRRAMKVEGSVALRRTRARAAPVDPVERAVHGVVLRAFAATGRPPVTAEFGEEAGPSQTGQVLRRLHEADVIRLDDAGDIRVAYPFSAVPTRHRVRLATGVEVYAMCVIDALGMPAMLGVDAVITTTDPTTHRPITVTVAGGQSTWDPATAVVFVRAEDRGPSADTCCDHLNAFVDRTAAESWRKDHPHVSGEIVHHTNAELLGRQIFGQLLA